MWFVEIVDYLKLKSNNGLFGIFRDYKRLKVFRGGFLFFFSVRVGGI